MEHLPLTKHFPAEPGVHFVEPALYPDELFELDCAFAEGNQTMIAFDRPEELITFLTEDHQSDTYVLNDTDGSAVGCISVIETSPESLEVLSIGVRPEAQGHGHGAALMQWAENLAMHTGRSQVHLVTKTSNMQAIRFYEYLGYNSVDVVANHYGEYGDNDPRVRMVKNLA